MSYPYHPPPPSSPFSGANYNSRPDYYQHPPSRPTPPEQVLASPPDLYSATSPPLPPTPSANFKNAGWPPPPVQALKSPKTFLQWKADAKATTADYQRYGYPSPVAWVITSSITHRLLLVHRSIIQVYVEGNEIPPNAVIGGVDRKGPWYIARSFYEVRYLLFLLHYLNLILVFAGLHG